MSRVRRVVVGLAVVMGAGGVADAVPAGGGGAAPAVAGQRHVPEAVRVPAGNRRIAVMPAVGVQTYQCTAGAWTFLRPDAILRHRGRAEVLHTRGPGLLGTVTFIQRLDTTGGLAPTSSCVDGATASVPYTADHAFWGTANQGQ